MIDRKEKLRAMMQVAETQLSKEELAGLFEVGLTKTEILAVFKKMMDTIQAHQQGNRNDFNATQGRYDQIVNEIKQNYSSDMEQVKQKALDFVNAENKKMVLSHGVRLGGMENKLNSVSAEHPRLYQRINDVKNELLSRLPKQVVLENEIPEMGKEIKESVQNLKEGERWEIEDVNGLKKKLEEMDKASNSRVSFGGGGGNKQNVYYYDLSASLDGSTKTFSLPAFSRILDVKLSSAPVLRPTVDWTSDTDTSSVTFTSEISADPLLLAGQSLMVLYAV